MPEATSRRAPAVEAPCAAERRCAGPRAGERRARSDRRERVGSDAAKADAAGRGGAGDSTPAGRDGRAASAPGGGRRCRVEQWEEVSGELKDLVRDELGVARRGEHRERELSSRRSPMRPRSAREPSFELSTSLYGIREVLRERLPPRRGQNGAAGAASRSNRSSPSTSARSGSTAGCTTRTASVEVIAVSPEGARVACSAAAPSATSVPTSSSSTRRSASTGRRRARLHRATSRWPPRACSPAAGSPSCALPTGSQLEIECPAVVRDPQTVRSTILGELGRPRQHRRPAGRDARQRRADPAAGADRRRIDRSSRSTSTATAPGESPEVSVVVPLYKRTRLPRAPAAAVLPRPRFRARPS